MNNLLAFRMKWYRENFLAFLRRYQHTVLIVIFAMYPIAGGNDFVMGLLKIISTPVLTICNQDVAAYLRLSTLLCVQVCFILWVLIQKDAVTGNPLTEYLMSFPIKKQYAWNVNLAVIAVANNIIWFLFVAAIIFTLLTPHKLLYIALSIINIISVAGLVLLAQVLWLYRSIKVYVVLLAINLTFVFFVSLGISSVVAIISVVFMASVAWMVMFFPKIFDSILCIAMSKRTMGMIAYNPLSFDRPASVYAIFAIYIKILFGFYKLQLLYRFVVGFLVSSLCILILHQSGLVLSSGYLLLFLSAIAFVASEIFSLLVVERNKMLPYMLSLPIKKGFWLVLDCGAIFFAALFMSSPVLLYIYKKGMIDYFTIAEAILFLSTLICSLFYARNVVEKQSASASIALCVLWSFVGFMITSG